jgi:hypothetical protein
LRFSTAALISELVNLPSDAFHRNVDEIIIGAGQQNSASVKVATQILDVDLVPDVLAFSNQKALLALQHRSAEQVGLDDWEGVSELVNLPSDAFHRNVDEIIIGAGQQNSASALVLNCQDTSAGGVDQP